jgi:hypothetical protein
MLSKIYRISSATIFKIGSGIIRYFLLIKLRFQMFTTTFAGNDEKLQVNELSRRALSDSESPTVPSRMTTKEVKCLLDL